MTLTPVFLTGFETGLVSDSGGGLISFHSTSGVTITTGSARSGTYGCQIVPGGSQAVMQWSLASANAKVYQRFAVRVQTRPAAATTLAYMDTSAATAGMAVLVDNSGVLTATINGTGTQTGPTLDTTSFHVIEMQADQSGTTWTMDWWVDGVQQTQVSVSGLTASSTVLRCFLGTQVAPFGTGTYFFDDWLVANWTVAGEQYGDGQILAYLPGSDGTHNVSNDFSPGDAGTAYASSGVTTAHTMVGDTPPWTTTRSTTDNIAQRTSNTAAYMEIAPATNSETRTANAVRALLAYSASGTASDNAACIARNSAGSAAVVWGDLAVAQGGNGGARSDYSESTNFFKGAIVPNPGSWTSSEVNAIRWRFGGSTDVSPIPTAQALMLEVDWPVSGGAVLSRTASDTSATSDSASRSALLFSRASADTTVTSDVAAGQVVLSRTAAETSATSDSATRAALHVARTTSDASATSDAATRLLVEARTASDSSSTTDSAAGVHVIPRTGSDTSTTTDSASRVALHLARATADTSALSDAATRLIVLARTTSDTTVTSDAAVGQLGKARTASDTSTTSDASVRLLVEARTASDTSLSTDTATRTIRLARTTADASTITDAAVGQLGKARTSSDTTATTDSATRLLVFGRTSSDTSASTDTASSTARRARAASDTSVTSDSAIGVRGTARTASDLSLTTDSTTSARRLVRAISDQTLTTDSAGVRFTYVRTAFDTSATSDSATGTIPLPFTPADLALTDFPFTTLTLADGVATNLTCHDAVLTTLVLTDFPATGLALADRTATTLTLEEVP